MSQRTLGSLQIWEWPKSDLGSCSKIQCQTLLGPLHIAGLCGIGDEGEDGEEEVRNS